MVMGVLDNPFLFTGRLTDTINDAAVTYADADTTGFRRLQDNRNRTYDPKHGRWLQRDPLGVRPNPPKGTIIPIKQYTDGMNGYEYVGSIPTRKRDPLGLAEWCDGFGCYPIPEPLPPPTPTPSTQTLCKNPGVTEYQQTWKVFWHKGLLISGSDIDFGPVNWWPSDWGQCPWPGNVVAVNNTVKTRTLSVNWKGRLRYGPGKGKRCCAATCFEIRACIHKVCSLWNGNNYHVHVRNCWHFVTNAKDSCCLY